MQFLQESLVELITQTATNWDQLGLLRQIGALPAQKGPDSFTTARA